MTGHISLYCHHAIRLTPRSDRPLLHAVTQDMTLLQNEVAVWATPVSYTCCTSSRSLLTAAWDRIEASGYRMSLLVGRITPGLAASPSRRRMTARRTCTTCAVLEQSYLEQSVAALTRRDFALSASAVLLISQLQAAHADESAGAATAVEAPAVASSSSSNNSGAPSRTLEPFIDNDFELKVPNNYRYLETEIPVVERGPQPERSPVLARFEPPAGGAGTISILRRKASALKQTLLQVNDISQLGDPISVAKLILPRGSTLVASAQQQVVQAPKETPLGQVELPPQNYYTFEFTTPTGLHVAMAAAAKKGSVLICGASTTADSWSEAGPVFRQVVKSFRLRSQAAIS